MKKHIYIAEALGTFTLTLAVSLSITELFVIPTPLIAALVLGLFVYSIGSVSGCHINPAVTIGLWSVGKIKRADAFGYIISQFIGAGIALIIAGYVSFPTLLPISGDISIGLAELVGTAFFTFGIASIVYGKAPSEVSGIVIGGSLLLGISFASLMGSNGVLNPAVAFGIKSFGIMYIIGPIIGSVIGMKTYKYLIAEK